MPLGIPDWAASACLALGAAMGIDSSKRYVPLAASTAVHPGSPECCMGGVTKRLTATLVSSYARAVARFGSSNSVAMARSANPAAKAVFASARVGALVLPQPTAKTVNRPRALRPA